MTVMERLIQETGEDENVLSNYVESAKNAILVRRYPDGNWPTREVTTTDEETGEEIVTEETYVEDIYLDVQYRLALAAYNKSGADFESSHSENGISRSWSSEGFPKEILHEIVPKYMKW